MREILALAALALLLCLASLGVVVWFVADAALHGLIRGFLLSLDGLLLIIVGLTLSAAFGFTFLWLAAEARLWDTLKERLPRLARKQTSTASEQKSPAGS